VNGIAVVLIVLAIVIVLLAVFNQLDKRDRRKTAEWYAAGCPVEPARAPARRLDQW
jgi:Na+-transporting methylmalonyl-CoA/oxaloacetate decarboxylase gamma subunit